MPLWVMVALGAGVLYLLAKSQAAPSPSQAGSPPAFYVGQIVNVPPNASVYSDAGLTSAAGVLSAAGAMTVKVIDQTHQSLGVLGPTGQGLGGGSLAYVAMKDATPSSG